MFPDRSLDELQTAKKRTLTRTSLNVSQTVRQPSRPDVYPSLSVWISRRGVIAAIRRFKELGESTRRRTFCPSTRSIIIGFDWKIAASYVQ